MTATIRVLHVDDEPTFLDLTRDLLEREDDRFEVVAETSAEAGLERLADERIDCIVSDYQMPDMDGLEFFAAVRERNDDLPFILFTGKGSEEIASEAITAGVTDYLQKRSGTEQYAILANRIDNAVERYRARREAVEARDRFEALLADAADYIHVVAADGTVQYTSPSVEHVLGLPADVMEGVNVFSRVHPEDRDRVRERFEAVVDDPDSEGLTEVRVKHRDGSWRWMEVKTRNLLDDPTVEGIVANVRDVTERREREAEVDWHKQIIQHMGEGVYVVDDDHEFRFVDYRAPNVDISEGDWRGRPLSHLADTGVFSESAVEEIRSAIDAVLAGEQSTARLELEPAIPPSTDVIELRLRPLPTAVAGSFVLGTTRDVSDQTERKRELERQNERLDEFATVVSHDLRNPLTVLHTSVELAEETGDSAHFDRCRRTIDEMERLIDDLLSLARQGDQIDTVEPVALAALAEARWETTETGAATLSAETDAVVVADESRLGQLLGNLFRNAVEHGSTSPDSQARRDATEHGGTDLQVRVGVLDDGDGFFVEDDGSGIPPEHRDRLFESGYSTTDDGTGFGLAIVRQIADAHGWSISVTESAEGGVADEDSESAARQSGRSGGARFEITGVEFA